MKREGRRGNLRNVVAGAVGNALEWYDFGVYGFMAPILGRLFFPDEDPIASLLAAFGTFAIGYVARPIGGAIFGHIGDRLGRKTTLVVSILVMGAATCAIGLLPDHSQIGTSAAVLLVVFRILQGLSVGGEYSGSIVFVAEHAPIQRRGLDASWPQFGCVIGFLMGSAAGALTATVFGQEAMDTWAWRVPFLFGAVIAVAGLLIRRHLSEPPSIRRLDRAAGSPVAVAVRDHWRAMLRLIALVMVGSVGFYMIFVYAAAYMTEEKRLTTAQALDLTTLSLLLYLAVTPLAATLSDRLGRKPMLYAVAFAALFFSWPLWWLMEQSAYLLILAGQMGFAVIFATAFAVTPSVMAEMLPGEVRCSGASLGYNLCLGLVGGTTPLVATYLVQLTANEFAPIYYLMAAAVVQLIALTGTKETARRALA